MLQELGVRTAAKIDWLGNLTFAAGLIAVLVGITHGILAYGGHNMGWTNPSVLTAILGRAPALSRSRGRQSRSRPGTAPRRVAVRGVGAAAVRARGEEPKARERAQLWELRALQDACRPQNASIQRALGA